ncbi:MAG: hypothetical protein WAP47_19955 [Candidatus Rokuibacteriota bacterium]
MPLLSPAAARHARPALRAALVAATLLALPTSAAPATAVTCQMLPQAAWGWTCPLSLPAAGEGGGELVLELDYTPPLRVQIAEVWEVTSPANESWQLVVRGSWSGGRGSLVVAGPLRRAAGLWRARPLGASVAPVGVRLTVSLREGGAAPQ